MAGDAVVGEEVRRVGEDEVDAVFGDGGEDFEAVAVEDFDVMGGVVKDGGGEGSAPRLTLFARDADPCRIVSVKGSVFCSLGGFAQWDGWIVDRMGTSVNKTGGKGGEQTASR